MPPVTLALALLASLTCVALTGCVSPVSGATPTSSAVNPTTEPIFASDEEALAAATKAYGDYVAMSDKIAQEGGVGVERITPFVTTSYLEIERAEYDRLRADSRRMIGSTSFRPVKIQRLTSQRGMAQIEAYFCVDVSDVRVMSASEADVTPTGKFEKYPILLGMTSSKLDPKLLKLDSSEVWMGENYC